jgi:Arc/MetJ-type ribon-helix-helix transcriptional regulator
MPDDEVMVAIQIRITQEMMRWVDERRMQMGVRPSRAQYIRYLIDVAREKLEGDERVVGAKRK